MIRKSWTAVSRHRHSEFLIVAAAIHVFITRSSMFCEKVSLVAEGVRPRYLNAFTELIC